MTEYPSDTDGDDKESPYQEQTGNYKPWAEPPTEQAQQLGKIGLGGEGLRRREKDRQGNIDQGIGSNEPELSEPERKAARDRSYKERRADLEQKLAEAGQLPESPDRIHKRAIVRKRLEDLDRSFIERHGYLPDYEGDQ